MAKDEIGVLSDLTNEFVFKRGDGSTRLNDLEYSPSVVKYSVNAPGDITTTATEDTLATSMTLTPSKGEYIAIFDSTATHSNNNSPIYYSIYVNGVQATNSERKFTCQNATERNTANTHTNGIEVDGTQAVEIRWRVDFGTGTMGNRSFTLIKVKHFD